MAKGSILLRLASVAVAAVAVYTMLRTASDAAQAPDAVRQSFARYEHAILTNDGATAVQLLSAGTLAWHGKIQRLALYGSKEEVERLSLVDKFEVLAFRLRVPANELRDMSPSQLIAYVIDHGWAAKPTVKRSELGDVEVSGTVATAELLLNHRPTGQTYQFLKEGGQWRLDQLPTLKTTNQQLQALARRRSLSDDQLIRQLVQGGVRKKVGESVWQPLFPPAETQR